MAKTKFEKGLEEKSLGYLVHMCAFNALAHTGSREELIARLVEWEKSQKPEPEPEPEVEPPATEPEVEPAAPEPEVEPAAPEPGEAPPAEE